jgi:hypothetical protein
MDRDVVLFLPERVDEIFRQYQAFLHTPIVEGRDSKPELARQAGRLLWKDVLPALRGYIYSLDRRIRGSTLVMDSSFGEISLRIRTRREQYDLRLLIKERRADVRRCSGDTAPLIQQSWNPATDSVTEVIEFLFSQAIKPHL